MNIWKNLLRDIIWDCYRIIILQHCRYVTNLCWKNTKLFSISVVHVLQNKFNSKDVVVFWLEKRRRIYKRMEREGFTVELRITYFCSGKYLQTKITNVLNGIMIKSWSRNGYFNDLLLWIGKSIFLIWMSQKSNKM